MSTFQVEGTACAKSWKWERARKSKKARVVEADQELDRVVQAESRVVACGRILHGLMHQVGDLGL